MHPQFASADGSPSHRVRDIYLLSPRLLPPEVIAVAFAKTSRSPLPFREIAAELSEERSGEFHERWVVGYGHASVAEHAVLHLAFENLSRLAVECLESNRLCSYTEKSTRYQLFDSFYVPEAIAASRHVDLYLETCRRLFSLYQESLGPIRGVIEGQNPRRADEPEAAYAARLRSRYIDVCRFLLPCCTLANVGMTANARALEHGIAKMLSHPLGEVRAIGEEARRAAAAEVPTLLKYAEPSPYMVESEAALRELAAGRSWPDLPAEGSGAGPGRGVRLVHYDRDAEARIVAAFLYRYGALSYDQAWSGASAMTRPERDRVIGEALGRLRPRGVPLREVEHTNYTFDIVCDQGAFFDLKRHRMATLTPQPPTVELGYAVPSAFEEAGLGPRYREAVDSATAASITIGRDLPHEAGYLVTNAHNRRFLLTLNLRELFHLIPLRAREAGHFSYRRIALMLLEAVREVHPGLAARIPFADPPPASAEIGRRHLAELFAAARR